MSLWNSEEMLRMLPWAQRQGCGDTVINHSEIPVDSSFPVPPHVRMSVLLQVTEMVWEGHEGVMQDSIFYQCTREV